MPRKTPVGGIATAIIPKEVLSVAKVKGSILAQLNKEKQEALRLMNMTIENWEYPPIMKGSMHYAGGNILIDVQPTPGGGDPSNFPGDRGEDKSVKKWVWLDKGTSVRYATMKQGFSRKTNPRQLHSGAGSGPSRDHLWFISRKKPHRGIQARQWSSIISRRMKKRLAPNIQAAINRGLQK